MSGEQLLLFQRGNGRGAVNAVVALDLAAVLDSLGDGRLDAGAVTATRRHDLGEIDGVRLCFSDATACPTAGSSSPPSPRAARTPTTTAQCVGVGRRDARRARGRDGAGSRSTPPSRSRASKRTATAMRSCILLVADADDPESPSPLLAAPLTV